jgi:hypothetical protein
MVIVLLAACGDTTPSPLPENHAPVAQLRTPTIVALNVDVIISAEGSSDPDGDPIVLNFSVAGGETFETRETQFITRFINAGQYNVTLTVTDIRGAETSLTHQITARDEFPDPPNFCSVDEPCVEANTYCDGGVCYEETMI